MKKLMFVVAMAALCMACQQQVEQKTASQQLLERHVLQSAAGQRGIQVVHIGEQVFAVVKTKRLGTDDGLQRIGGVGQRHQLKFSVNR